MRLIPAVLAQIEQREVNLLASTVGRLLQIARMIALDGPMFAQAMRYLDRYGLSAQDAIIYAAVISDLSQLARGAPHYFMSKNWRDFGDPRIHAELATHSCTFIKGFEGARLLGAG